MNHNITRSNFITSKAEKVYVAYIDILGFGDFVLNNFAEVFNIYCDIMCDNKIIEGMNSGVDIRVYSDAFMLTSNKLGDLVGVIQAIYMRTLCRDWLIRGGIGYGNHIEASNEKNLFIISEALIHAAKKEKTIKYPCVAFDESVLIPDEWWDSKIHPIDRGIAHFEGISMILPFNRFWSQSAMTRVAQMATKDSSHKDKLEWFLRLYDHAISGDPLIPETKS